MNLIESLEMHGIQFRRSAKPGEIWICCPFCVEEGQPSYDTKYRLGINAETGWMHCFNCEKRSKDAKYTFAELNRMLATGEMYVEARQPRKSPKVYLPEDFARVRPYSKKRDHWNNVAYKFLKTRNVKDIQIKEKRIGYSVTGRYHHRVIIPIYYWRKYKGKKLMGFVGRDFTNEQEPPYKNSEGDKSCINIPRDRKRGAVLVEGAFDAYAVERGCGSFNLDAVGVLGHSLTDLQLDQLEDYRHLVLWPDPDKAGVEGFLRMGRQLQKRKREIDFVVPLMNGEENYDPDEYSSLEIHKKLKKVRPLTPELESRLRAWIAFQDD